MTRVTNGVDGRDRGTAKDLGAEKATWFRGEKWLVIAGLLGFVFAIVSGIAALVYGTDAKPGSGLLRAASFNAALAIFSYRQQQFCPFRVWGRRVESFSDGHI